MRNYQETKDAISNYLANNDSASVKKIQDHLLEIGIGATQAEIGMIMQEIKENDKNRKRYKIDMETKEKS